MQKQLPNMEINENNIQDIRADFPILNQKIYGKPLIYFDNAATTQKPWSVINKIEEGYKFNNANVHRGVHFLSQVATEAHEEARRTVCDFIGADKVEEIVFTRGTTESINLVAFSFGETYLKEGDEIIVSEMEHHSNIVPWQMLQSRKGINIKVWHFKPSGELDVDALPNLITEKTKLIAVTHVSNTLGTINPIKDITKIAHKYGVPVLVDGAQSIPHLAINVKDLDADFFVFSAHKIYGPTGMGVLYGKEKYLDAMVPYQGGGEMIERVSFQHTSYNHLPFKFEAGTPDFIGSTALAEAIRYVQKIGMDNIALYEHSLLKYATEQLKTIEGMRIFGEAPDKGAVVSMQVGNIHHYDMGTLLDKLGIALRTGHHCAQPVMDYYGIEGTLRASFALYNTKEEIDMLIYGINRAQKLF
ncbi:MAG: Cysteine desulfurase [Bacteroidetes bacterium ADurb.Bin302]|nr:MAG: Cysteine desulfurase [Bacteroidetes bacterium ADurb.Bin302]